MTLYYKPGCHNFECDICREWCKSSEKRKQWNNAVVCKDCWDPKPGFMYPLPRVRDMIPVKDPRPATTFTYTYTGNDTTTWENDTMIWDTDPIFLGLDPNGDNWED